jgi:hypothetical protein
MQTLGRSAPHEAAEHDHGDHRDERVQRRGDHEVLADVNRFHGEEVSDVVGDHQRHPGDADGESLTHAAALDAPQIVDGKGHNQQDEHEKPRHCERRVRTNVIREELRDADECKPQPPDEEAVDDGSDGSIHGSVFSSLRNLTGPRCAAHGQCLRRSI